MKALIVDDSKINLIVAQKIMEKIGFTIGKFAPLHKGHQLLLETALKELDFTGKTIRIVTTHEGSGLANVVDDIRKICKGAVINDFIAIKGSECINAKNTIENWL